MKTRNLFLAVAFSFPFLMYAQVGISESGNPPDASAMMDVESTSKGFLPPRMTTAQRDAIGSPAEGLMIYNTDDGSLQFWDGTWWYDLSGGNEYLQFPVGTVFCAGGPTAIVDVTNTTTGKTWMDRNLGASQQATASNDYEAYGSLYQWGRLSDGHQCINWTSSTGSDGTEQSNETSTLSSTDDPGHGDFILGPNDPYDWRSPQNDNLWQGTSGTNNPCPAGYRLPTQTELVNERESWSTRNAAGAFASPLKLPVAGYRQSSDGSLIFVGSYGHYWSSTVDVTSSWFLGFYNGWADMYSSYRTGGFSVRFIQD